MIKSQFDSLVKDFTIKWCKTGMLYSKKIVDLVALLIRKNRINCVVDPVLVAGTQSPLSKKGLAERIMAKIVPRAKIVTPNVFEAETLAGIKIKKTEDMRKAAEIICDKGAEMAVVTGGHLSGVDLFFDGSKFYEFPGKIVGTKTIHGIGCSYSAYVTAELAKGGNVLKVLRSARRFSEKTAKFSKKLGKGSRIAFQVG